MNKIKTEKRRLEAILYGARYEISSAELENIEFESYLNQELKRMVYQIRETVWTEKNDTKKRIFFETPATWWNMFKEQYFTEKMKKRFPVKYKNISKRVTFREMIKYPEFPTPISGYGSGVRDVDILE